MFLLHGVKSYLCDFEWKNRRQQSGVDNFYFHLFENSIKSRDTNTGRNVSASKFQKLNFITINLLKYCQHLDFLKTNVFLKNFY